MRGIRFESKVLGFRVLGIFSVGLVAGEREEVSSRVVAQGAGTEVVVVVSVQRDNLGGVFVVLGVLARLSLVLDVE